MTDDAPKIIPFGKYKGRLVEELLVDDRAGLVSRRSPAPIYLGVGVEV